MNESDLPDDPLEFGNYWIYQHFILVGTNYPFNSGRSAILDILRDSAGYFVNSAGAIKFSETNFTDVLAQKTVVINEDTLYHLTFQMEVVDAPYAAPVGVLNVLNYKGTVVTPRDLPGISNPR